MKLKFMGAAGTVTGSKTILEYGNKKFLVDCGMFQGAKKRRLQNWDMGIPTSEITAVILTHAHVDHSGMLPRLYREGFRGPVYCSPGTRELCEVLLKDAAYLQEEDARYANWREQFGAKWWWMSYLRVFILQGTVMWIVSLPLLVGLQDKSSLSGLDWLGMLLFANRVQKCHYRW